MSTLTIHAFDTRDTFDSVKEVLESHSLRKLRASNIHKAVKLQLKEEREVKIIFNTDFEEDKIIVSPIYEADILNIGIANNQYIPIRAIKEVRL